METLYRVDALAIPRVTIPRGLGSAWSPRSSGCVLLGRHQSPGSVLWIFLPWVNAHHIPRVTAPCGCQRVTAPTAKKICLVYSPSVSWIGNFWNACLGSTPTVPHGLPSRVTVRGSWLSSQEDLSGYSPAVPWVGNSLLHRHSKPSQPSKHDTA